MSEKMSESSDDLSAVAWVHEELRRSLDAAHKALRRFGKETEALDGSDVDAVDPAVLRSARAQIHQGVGALELVGLPAAALVLRASEALVQRAVAKPQSLTPAVIADIERASFALLDYLARMLAGKAVSPLSLFPQYRAVQDAAESQRVHPADLWSVDWRWRELADDPSARPGNADATIHDALEDQLLVLMRGIQPQAAARRISDICANLGSGATDPEVATLWKLASAVFEAQASGLLGFDLFTKRVASRLLAQFRILERGESDVSERLARDLLFFCAQSAMAPDNKAPRLAAVRQAYALPEEAPVDYSVSVLGRFDPALIVHARKRVASAKEAWSSVAGGEMHRLPGLSEQFSLVGDSLKKLFPLGEVFANELQHAVAQTQAAGAAPPAPLAMEVATSLLYVEAALEDADFDDPEHAGRVRRLADRLALVRQNQPPEPLEGWMEELYRRVSDRQTMGSVVQELRASLSEAEKSIDQFFRNPADPKVLIPVPQQLSSMRGVLSVLGMDHASAVLLRMRDEVDGLASTEVDPARVVQAGVFDRLAGNLSALGFLIDMLSVQPQMAKSLFAYDAETGMLSPVMGRSVDTEHMTIGLPSLAPAVEPRLIEQAQMLAFSSVREDVPLHEVTRELERLSHEAQAADQPGLAATVLKAQEAFERAEGAADISTARGELSEALVDFVATASEPSTLEPEPAVAPRQTMTPAVEISDFQEDDEMRSVFLEEAREVIGDAQAACKTLAQSPSDLGLLTTLRRAFHTLKGSSRMVGLKEFGDAAWTCEQLFNTHLAEQRAVEPALVEFTAWSLGYLGAWADNIAAHRPSAHDAATLKAKAEQMSGQLQGEASDIALPLGFPPDMPSATDLDFGVAPAAAPQVRAAADSSPPATEVDGLAFELDLSGLDAPANASLQAYTPARPHMDPTVQALFDPFDVQPTAAMPLRQGVDVEVDIDDVLSGPIDLDLGVEAPEDPFIRNLEPSRPAGVDEAGRQPESGAEPLPELVLDLSDPESRPDLEAPDTRVEAHAPSGTAPVELPEVTEIVETAEVADADASRGDDELVKVVGPLRISIPLFNIYLNEADELSRRLTTEVAEWAMELHRPIGEAPVALAHSLAGSSATVGFADLSHLARVLEHAQMRSQAIGHGTPEEAALFVESTEEIRRLLHQFAAGFLRDASPDLLQRLADHEVSSGKRLEAATAADELSPGDDDPEVEAMARESSMDTLLALDLAQEPDTWTDVSVAAVPPPESAPDRVATAPAALDALEPPVVAKDHPVDAAPAAPATSASADAWVEPPLEEEVSVTGEQEAEEHEAEAPRSAFGALQGRFDPLGMSELKPLAALPVETMKPVAARDDTGDADDDIDAQDAVDAELFPIFEEEGHELIQKLAAQLRDWVRNPEATTHAAGCMRTLHTLKGGARLAGAMRLGEMAHRLETRIERILAHPPAQLDDLEALQGRSDGLAQTLEALRRGADAAATPAPFAEPAVAAMLSPETAPTTVARTVAAPVEPALAAPAPLVQTAGGSSIPASPPEASGGPGSRKKIRAERDAAAAAARADAKAGPSIRTDAPQSPVELPAIDWSRFSTPGPGRGRPVERGLAASQATVRVRAPLLDRLVNLAGEISITRSRVEAGVGQIKGSLADLTENLERLRGQLRDIEIQGEVQMSSRLEAAKAAAQTFDPLEFDRFTRFQELTRMMAESVNDVATVQRTVQRSLETTEDELVSQARMTRDLQDDLLRTRMVEFEGLSDRLYRVVRQAAKETAKQVRLDIVGGSIEIDRGVLDRMIGAFEHLLRNCVTHGIEAPAQRTAAGKEAVGSIIVALSHEGNEVGVEFRDDGGGLDLALIRRKGVDMRLLDPAAEPSDMELANLIFTPGFSTATIVTELAGRGVGMDVVRSDVVAMGGRIETATESGKGTSFKLILPLTTAVTQVVMLRCGETTVAVPSTLVETVRRATIQEVDEAYASGTYAFADKALQFFWLGALLQISARPGASVGRMRSVVVVRSAQQRIVVHVDEVVGNQEVVVKNLGPQLSRLPGLAGMTLLASGAVALIYNPVALATLYGEGAREVTNAALRATAHAPLMPHAAEAETPVAPLVLVVDDSLTVRRVTQRLLVREGYRVVLAKDGLDALERLAEELPSIVLSDIEMPRMDGFDLVRNIRADVRLRALPVIMITSRIAQKHRDHATELGVDHYLGKPYSEEDLLGLIGRYTAKVARA